MIVDPDKEKVIEFARRLGAVFAAAGVTAERAYLVGQRSSNSRIYGSLKDTLIFPTVFTVRINCVYKEDLKSAQGKILGAGFWKGAGWYPGRMVSGAMPMALARWGPWWHAAAGPYYAPGWGGPYGLTPEDEKAFLREQAEELKAELAELEKRLSELEES